MGGLNTLIQSLYIWKNERKSVVDEVDKIYRYSILIIFSFAMTSSFLNQSLYIHTLAESNSARARNYVKNAEERIGSFDRGFFTFIFFGLD